MMFEPITEGFVCLREPDGPTAVAMAPRCAVAANGELVCTYRVQSALGINDKMSMISLSKDNGETWSEQKHIWPALEDTFSVSCSVSRSPSGELFLYGTRTPIDEPGEPYWSDVTHGMKQNELMWAKSVDSGYTWTDPTVIPMQIPGSAEAPGAMCITRDGRWIAPYAPYNTFDPQLVVERNQVVAMVSDNEGRTWSHRSMLRFDDAYSGASESWVVELADGRLLGASWHHSYSDGSDYPNAYAISIDGGLTWGATRSTGIMGQSAALAALPDGRALFIYNQRKHGEVGVWLAIVNPTESDFGVEANEVIWRAETGTQTGTSGELFEWTDFSFGEPSIMLLPDGALLAALWCIHPSGRGIKYIKLRMKH